MAFLFGASNQPPPFQLIRFDTSVLAGAFNSKIALAGVNSADSQLAAKIDAFRGPAVIPPWQIPTEPQSLEARLRDARSLEKFIDLKSNDVKRAGDDLDSRALFALYNGLKALQSLAQFAAEKNTPTASLGRLDLKFQQGFEEISAFLETAVLDKLTLFRGEKSNRVESAASLGKASSKFVGKIIQTEGRNDPLANIAGNEVFTIRLEKTTGFDEVAVDLSEISGTVSINAVVNLINEKISAVKVLDVDGQPILDADGNSISKYLTRVSVNTKGEIGHGIQIDGVSSETLSFTAQAAEPALFVAGNVAGFLDDFSNGTLTKISGVDGADPTRSSADIIAGIDRNTTAVSELAHAKSGGSEEDKPDPTTAETTANAVVADSQGNLYVVGRSQGSFGSQFNDATEGDVFLTKLSADGDVIFSRLLGATSDANAFSVTVDGEDNVIIAGQTDSKLNSADAIAGTDSFVTKFNDRGDQLFTYQLDTFKEDGAFAVTTDANNDIFVAGYTRGAVNNGVSYGGGKDGFVLKLGGEDGAVQSSGQFGGAGNEEVRAITVAADGNILIASVEDGTATLKKLDAADLSNQIFSTALGSLDGGTVSGIAVEGNSVFITGSASNANFGGGARPVAHSGGVDGFVVGLNDNGGSASINFTTFLGSVETDRVNAVTINNGKVFVAGETNGGIQGESKKGFKDAFAAKIDGTTGAIDFVEQFGLLLSNNAGSGIAFTNSGSSVLTQLGLPVGTFNPVETRDIVTQTTVRSGDQFFISIDGARARKITIEAGDTFKKIAAKINRLSFRKIKAVEVSGPDGPTLKIEAVNGAKIDIISGPDDKDALARLGIEPTRILSTELLFDLEEEDEGADADNLGGSFALDLPLGLHLRDKATAKFVLSQLDTAIATVQRAFRSLTFDPFAAALKREAQFAGDTPPRIAKQLAGFQEALFRLQAVNQSAGFNLFI